MAGPFSGEVTLFSSDFNESPSTFTLDGDVVNSLLSVTPSQIVDDGGAGYGDTGWPSSEATGYNGDQRQLPWNAGPAAATWTFTELTANSLYRVSAHWQTINIRTTAENISVHGRNTQGVTLMKTADEKISSIAKVVEK